MKVITDLKNHKYSFLVDIAVFGILIIGFHFLFRLWAYRLYYWPIHFMVMPVYDVLVELLFNNSVWALHHLTHYTFTTNGHDILMAKGYVGVHAGCSGLKQFLEWIVLMVFFPGPWKHKLWFIPVGLLVTHLVNVFRISFLSVLLNYYPQYWHFTHDNILRPFFYVVMFGMWVIWVEKFRNPASERTQMKRPPKDTV